MWPEYKKNGLFLFLCIACILFLGCSSDSTKTKTLELDKKYWKFSSFPFTPVRIQVVETPDSIQIRQFFKTGDEKKYQLFKKSGEFYFLNKQLNLQKKYTASSYLFLRNSGSDSCYSLSKKSNLNQGKNGSYRSMDVCFSKIKGGNFTTIIRFNTNDTLSHSENFFYTRKYKIYKYAVKYRDSVYWYKIKH